MVFSHSQIIEWDMRKYLVIGRKFSPATFVINMKTIIKCLILLIHLIGFIQCQRLSKDDDSTRRQDVAPRHQEYDKKMLEALLKEVISDELSKMSK